MSGARWISLEVASRLTDPPLSLSTLRYWILLGRVTRHRVPGSRRLFLDREELMRLLERGEG